MGILTIHTGKNRLLPAALARDVKNSECAGKVIIVPRQLTLLTERMIFEALELEGSFDIHVYGEKRFCSRVFEAAGMPEGVVLDERGRAILVHRAIMETSDRLEIYKEAAHKRGFVERACAQLDTLRQAGISPDQLGEYAAEKTGSAGQKLSDIAKIQQAYEEMLTGHYLDEEEIFAQAGRLARDAAFLKDTQLFIYGYDMMPPALIRFLTQVSAAAACAEIYLPTDNTADGRDRLCWAPMDGTVNRVRAEAKGIGMETRREAVEEDGADSARRENIRLLETELFAQDPKVMPSDGSVTLAEFPNVREECRRTAARIRALVRQNGWRYKDIAVLCADVAGCGQMIRTAFAEFEVPVVLSERRAAARHPAAELLLTALNAVARDFSEEDMAALLHTGMCGLTESQADRLANWAFRYGLRGSRWTNPLRVPRDANERRQQKLQRERDQMEPLREKVMAPLIRLKKGLKDAKDLTAQLTAVFDYLEDSHVYGENLRRTDRLKTEGLWQEAGEEIQVWNRIVGTLEQMNELCDSEKPMPVAELREILTQSLSMSVIRALPQSGDAVYVQGVDSMLREPCKALFVLGMAEKGSRNETGLLTSAQREELSRRYRCYLGPTDTDIALLDRYYLKSSLGMVSDEVYISCPLTNAAGEGQKPGMLFDMIKRLITGVRSVSYVLDEGGELTPEKREMMSSARSVIAEAAAGVARLNDKDSVGRAGEAALAAVSLSGGAEEKTALAYLRMAAEPEAGGDTMDAAVAEKLYGKLEMQSVSSLETFAQCPLKYFTSYGLFPAKVDPYTLTSADEGTYLHACAERFVQENRERLSAMEADEAREKMGVIADEEYAKMADTGAIGDTEVTKQEYTRLRRIACFASEMVVTQMRGSEFVNTHTEREIGSGDQKGITLSDGTVLKGRIDRTDAWGSYLRVIDYKRGKHEVDLGQVYYGLQLQLMLYMAGAERMDEKDTAGVYYFTFKDGTVDVDSTDPNEICEVRKKLMQLSGLVPEEEELREAMTPDQGMVLGVKKNKDGSVSKSTKLVTREQYGRIVRHAERRAAEHIAGIRGGRCAASPAKLKGAGDPCEYCDLKGKVCMRADTRQDRRFKPLKYEEAMALIDQEESPV